MAVVRDVVSWVKQRHLVFDTPITLEPHQTVGDAMALLPKRSHRAAFVVEDGRPVGVLTHDDCAEVDRFTQVHQVMSANPLTLPDTVTPREAYDRLDGARRRVAPVVDPDGRLVGVLTKTLALRSTLYTPAARRRRPAADRCRPRRERRREVQGRRPAGGRRRLPRDGHRPRPPGPDGPGAAGGPGPRPAGAAGGRQRGLRRGRGRARRRRVPTSSRSVSGRARCARRG